MEMIKHGYANKPIYKVWNAIKQRCFNKNNLYYSRYGGRGITMCDEWLDFTNFLNWSVSNGYRIGLDIDRINNDGNYEPVNCRWVAHSINMNNRNVTTYLYIDGHKLSLNAYASMAEIDYISLRTALKRMEKH